MQTKTMRIMGMFFSIYLLFSVAACSDGVVEKKNISSTDKAEDAKWAHLKEEGRYIWDNALVLSEDNRQELEKELSKLANETGIQFYLYTVPELGEQSLQELSLDVSTHLHAGQEGLNNGGIIFMAKNERQVKVEVNYGLEWQINTTETSKIIDQMRPGLSQGDYYSAFVLAFKSMTEKALSTSWTIDYHTFPALQIDQANSLGKIVSFQGRGITRDYSRVPIERQFDENLFIAVKPQNAERVKLNFSNYMVEMVNVIVYAEEDAQVFARVTNTNPLELNLLGIVW